MKSWLIKGFLSTLLACSPFLAATAAFAEEEGLVVIEEPDTAEEVGEQIELDTPKEPEQTEVIDTTDTTDTAEEVGEQIESDTPEETEQIEETNVEVREPSLVPGDFFYFVKTTVEKIRLALETNELEEAKLLASMAAERIAEAKVLIENGEEEYTNETLERAAEQTEQATELSEREEAQTSKRKTAEVQVKISHNIEALARVLDKVENPKAQAAIAKNIEKRFTKLAAKIERVQQKELTVVEEEAGEVLLDEVTDVQEQPVTEEVETEVTEQETIVEQSVEAAAVTAAVTTAAATTAAVHAPVQQEQAVLENKQEKQAMKQAQKKEKKEEKQEKREQRENKKNSKKEEHAKDKGKEKK